MSRKKIFYSLILALMPSLAEASGNPIILYWFAGIGLLHSTLLATVLVSKYFSNYKVTCFIILLSVEIFLWFWGWSYRGPDFSFMYFIMITVPLIIIVPMLWISIRMRRV